MKPTLTLSCVFSILFQYVVTKYRVGKKYLLKSLIYKDLHAIESGEHDSYDNNEIVEEELAESVNQEKKLVILLIFLLKNMLNLWEKSNQNVEYLLFWLNLSLFNLEKSNKLVV